MKNDRDGNGEWLQQVLTRFEDYIHTVNSYIRQNEERMKRNDERWQKNDERWQKNDARWQKNDAYLRNAYKILNHLVAEMRAMKRPR